jgi:hypothetical protein
MAVCGGSPERACATAFGFGRFRAQIKAGLRRKKRGGVGGAPREKREGKEKRGRLGWVSILTQIRLENWKTSSFSRSFINSKLI